MPRLTARPSIRLLCASAFLAAGLAAASCDSAEQPVAPSDVVPTITLTSDGIAPTVPSLFPGVRIRILNNDTKPHRLHLDLGAVQPGCEALDASGEVGPGQSVLTAPLGLDVAECSIHDHMSHGDSRFAVRLTAEDGQ